VLALLIPAFFGVVAGVEVLEAADPEYVQLGIGVLVVFFALLLLREIRVPGAGTRWGPLVEGSASGALSTSTGLAGPPMALPLASRGLPNRPFSGSSALYFLPLNVVIIASLIPRGILDGGHARLHRPRLRPRPARRARSLARLAERKLGRKERR
jgi:uncharacterized protein